MATQTQYVSWTDLLNAVQDRLWVICICILAFGGIFASYALLATPIYRATTIVIPASSERPGGWGLSAALATSLGGVADLTGIRGAANDPLTNEAIAVLASRSFTEEFIKDNSLTDLLLSEKREQRTLGRAARVFDKEVRTITMDSKTGLVMIHMEWRDPFVAADWANKIVVRLNEELRTRALSDANRAMNFLEREIGKAIDVTTRDALSRLMESQAKARMYATVTEEYAFKVVDPATPPDPDEYVRPRRAVLIAVGLFIGLVSGVGLAVVLGPIRKRS